MARMSIFSPFSNERDFSPGTILIAREHYGVEGVAVGPLFLHLYGVFQTASAVKLSSIRRRDLINNRLGVMQDVWLASNEPSGQSQMRSLTNRRQKSCWQARNYLR